MAYLDVIKISAFKAILNVKSEMSDNRMSYAWLVLEPALFMGVYFVVFGMLLERGAPNFIEFLLVGLIPWLWFSRCISKSSSIFIQSRNIIAQAKVSKLYFVYSLVFQESLKQASILLIFSFLLTLFTRNQVNYLLLFLVIPINLIFNLSCALILSVVTTFFRDIKQIIPSTLRVLLYGSGVVYSVEKVPEKYHILFDINPIYNIVSLYRSALLSMNSNYVDLVYMLAIVSLSLFVVSHVIIKALDDKITREVLL